jgi:hypothetical protein
MLGPFAGDVARPIGQRLKFLGYLHVQRHDALIDLTLAAILGSDRRPRYSLARSRAASGLALGSISIIGGGTFGL